MNDMVTDDRRQGLVLPGPGRWGWYDAAAYERVEQRLQQTERICCSDVQTGSDS